MHYYCKYTGKKASKSPLEVSQNERKRNKDPISIDIHRFRDTNSSIRFDSKLDYQRAEAMVTQHEPPSTLGELSTLNHYPDHLVNHTQNNRESRETLVVDKSYMKSQQARQWKNCGKVLSYTLSIPS